MRYLGGKARIAANLYKRGMAPLISEWEKRCGYKMPYVEPFVGGANSMVVAAGADPERPCFGSDFDSNILCVWTAVSDGWVPPRSISRDFYNNCKIKRRAGDVSPLVCYCGYAASFAGVFYSTYASGQTEAGYRFVEKHRTDLERVHWCPKAIDYRQIVPKGCVVYCDPPYARTAAKYNKQKFDHDAFWDTVRRWSRENLVFVSEMDAPEDFEVICEKDTPVSVCNNRYPGVSAPKRRKERLYSLCRVNPPRPPAKPMLQWNHRRAYPTRRV